MPSQAAKLRAQKKKQAQKNKGKPKNGAKNEASNGIFVLIVKKLKKDCCF